MPIRHMNLCIVSSHITGDETWILTRHEGDENREALSRLELS